MTGELRSPRNPHAQAAGVVVAVMGAIGAAGWVLDVARFRQLAPDQVSMKFDAAVCLVLLGATVAVGARSRFATVVSVVVGAVASVTLMEYLTGWSVGLDELFFSEPERGPGPPGRMAATTAVCLALSVVALVGIRRQRVRLVTVTARMVLLLSWLGCLGYAFGVPALYELGPFAAMAVHTAAALFVLSVGLLLSCPDGPLSTVLYDDGPGAAVLRQALPLAVFGLPAVAAASWAGVRADWYEPELGVAVIVLGSAFLVIVVSVISAKVVARLNLAAELANDLLQATNTGLEATVAERTADLAASEARARALADGAPVGIFHTDAHGRMTYANQRWLDIVGRSADEVIGGTWIDWVEPSDVPMVLREWTTASGTGTRFDVELRIVQPTGIVRWVRAHTAGAMHEGDERSAVVGTMDDITPRVEAQLARRRAEAMFRTTFEASPVAMAIVDRAGVIARANPALARLTGFSVAELARRPVQVLLDPDDDYRAAEGETRDHRLHRRDGIGWVSIHAARIDPAGPDTSVCEVIQFVDTATRVELEHRLADLAAHDPLTGLRNRRSFETAMSEHAARCRRYGATGSLLLIDLDHFKQINDTFGHETGDRALVALTTALVAALRDSDVIARLGGDEFAVLLPVGGAAEAETVAECLLQRAREAGPVTPGALSPITLSIGISSFDGRGRSTDAVFAEADRALYEAKALGRDRWASCTTVTAG